MSPTLETFVTAARCISEKPDVIRSMMACGDGLLEPSVPSAQTSLCEESKLSVKLPTRTGCPSPY